MFILPNSFKINLCILVCVHARACANACHDTCAEVRLKQDLEMDPGLTMGTFIYQGISPAHYFPNSLTSLLFMIWLKQIQRSALCVLCCFTCCVCFIWGCVKLDLLTCCLTLSGYEEPTKAESFCCFPQTLKDTEHCAAPSRLLLCAVSTHIG